ncbi:MAG TPA: Gfo/Idh/MocA family oxidoreductase [Gemmatimonadaceae bacterium]|nr:Gfo/Idh/MocA family oxidoreductase [Gemmatimonadaceae bacterium]
MTDTQPVRWGILGTAGIALNKVIPAMRASRLSVPHAIASRDLGKAREAADRLGIARAYGSYDELLEDADVEAIYNPLPNHLHVPWSVRAAEAKKHVLCEKPISLSADEARTLIAARDANGVQIAEAFMVRAHPQWAVVAQLIAEDRIGPLRLVAGHFSYFRRDPTDIRSVPEWGGGALMDIGCYPIFIARWMFGTEPTDAVAMLERDPDMGIDRLTSAMLRFPNGQATFSCAGQLVPFQRMQLYGERGRIEVEIPFNAPSDRATRIFVDDGSQLGGASARIIEIAGVDQYTLQADLFSSALRGVGDVPVSLECAVGNMEVIDALVRSASGKSWVSVRRAGI